MYHLIKRDHKHAIKQKCHTKEPMVNHFLKSLLQQRKNKTFTESRVFVKEIEPETLYTQTQQKYSRLAHESIQKNYQVTNLNPYASFLEPEQFQTQVDQLLTKTFNTNLSTKYLLREQNISIKKKFSSFIQNTQKDTIKKYKHPKRKKLKLKLKIQSQLLKPTTQFIKTDIEDDHQCLMEDYHDEVKHNSLNKKKLYLKLNRKIASKYTSNLCTSKKTAEKNDKNIQKFKRPDTVTKTFTNKSQPQLIISDLKKNQRKFSLYQINKNDYGIYSRSVNKALHYYHQTDRNADVDTQQRRNSWMKPHKATHIYYQKYIQSYESRKNILNSTYSLIK